MRPLQVSPSDLVPGVVVEVDASRHRARPSGRGFTTAPGVTRLARFARWNRSGFPAFYFERRDQGTGRGLGTYLTAATPIEDMTLLIRIVSPGGG